MSEAENAVRRRPALDTSRFGDAAAKARWEAEAEAEAAGVALMLSGEPVYDNDGNEMDDPYERGYWARYHGYGRPPNPKIMDRNLSYAKQFIKGWDECDGELAFEVIERLRLAAYQEGLKRGLEEALKVAKT